jgi:hypothetical protein
MNTFLILEYRTDGDILFTKVRYNDDFEVEVAHYYPKDDAEINQNIINRGLTEIEKRKRIEDLENILPLIQTGVEIKF